MEDWKDEVTAALEQLDVADTLEELRHHIDALIERLSAESPGEEPVVKEPANAAGLDGQIDSLGRKVESASSMLAELTDLLESQSERLETIERQIGDPDEREPNMAAQAPESALPGSELRALIEALRFEAVGLQEQRGLFDTRLDRLEATVSRLDVSVEALGKSITGRERWLEDIEDRLLVFFESRSDAAFPAAAADATQPFSAPAAIETPSRLPERPELDFDGPMDAATARRLESLVEREIKLQHEFAPGAEIARMANMRTARPTVMVVDDSVDARTVLSIYLSRTGYHVVTAASAEDCLAKLRHHAVDAVVLDATMPGGGGEHFLRVLHSDPAYRDRADLPVIVYTAHPETMSRERARQLGASDYLVKGGDLLPLLTALMRHLHTGAEEPPPTTVRG